MKIVKFILTWIPFVGMLGGYWWVGLPIKRWHLWWTIYQIYSSAALGILLLESIGV